MDIEKEIETLTRDLAQCEQQIAQLVAMRERIVGALAFAQRIRAEPAAAPAEETAPAGV